MSMIIIFQNQDVLKIGEHEVIFAGTDEVIEIKHTAYSRAVFGKGAISAAKFLCGKKSGMFTMKEVVDAK